MSEFDSGIAVNLDKYSEPMELGELYDKDSPIEIEIGSGKGTFLINQGRLHPDVNYLGVEWARKWYLYTIDRVERWHLSNIRVLRTDARDFIGRFIKDGSVSVFHVYYPDPWPKKRHQKRRFFAQDNILQVIRCLKVGGQLRLATDHAEYFEVMKEVLLEDPVISSKLEKIEFQKADAASEGEWVGTNYERKYIKEGRGSYKLAFIKK